MFERDLPNNEIAFEKIQVRAIKLDTLFKDKVEPDFIKIDVEGSELRVLKGAREILKKGRAKFLIEVHSWVDPEGQKSPEDVYRLMKSYGYQAINFHGRALFVKGMNFLKYKICILFDRLKETFRRRFTLLISNGQWY